MSLTGLSKSDRVFLLLWVGFAVFLAYFCHLLLAAMPDGFRAEQYYHDVAVNLLHHGVHSENREPPIAPSHLRVPLYPAVLAAAYAMLGERPATGVMINAALLAVTVGLAYLLGRRWGAASGWLAALAVALDPIQWVTSASNASDALFVTLVAAALVAAARIVDGDRRLGMIATCSALTALAALTRAHGIYLWLPVMAALVVAAWHYETKSRLAAMVGVFLAVQALLVGGWLLRNTVVMKDPRLVGMTSSHFITFMAPEIMARNEGISIAAARNKLVAELQATDAWKRAADAIEIERLRRDFALDYIRKHPDTVIVNTLRNIPDLFLSHAWEGTEVFAGPARLKATLDVSNRFSTATFETAGRARGLEARWAMVKETIARGMLSTLLYGIFVKAFNAGIVLAGIAGGLLLMTHATGSGRWNGVLLFVFCAMMTAIAALTFQGRFRMPIMPAAGALAGYALTWAWMRWRASRQA